MGPGNTPKPFISPLRIALLWSCILLHGAGARVLSQHIPVTNPSLEGIPAERQAPPGWRPVATSDIQPGVYNITKPASAGRTYIGLHSGPNYTEGISQQLSGTMKAGYQYSMYFDLAFAPLYAYEACYANLGIYGGYQEGDLKELLWSSGNFYDTSWIRHDASFTPAVSYPWLTIVAYYPEDCNKSLHGVAVLIDNISSWIYEHPKLEFSVTPACTEDNTGEIRVKVLGANPPYTYQWSPESGNTPTLVNLFPGKYELQVTDSKGISVQGSATLPPPLLLRSVTTKPCSCGEVNNGKIILGLSGGTPPYEFSVDSDLWQADSVLGALAPGNHRYEIKDSNECYIAGVADITSPYPHCLVVLPNAFSPNGDGNNDVFRPKVYDDVHNYQLSIYNRWGSLIFRTNDPGAGWNGAYKGSAAPAQHYVYVCTYMDHNNEAQELTGAFMLLR